MADKTIKIKINPELAEKAEAILSKLGLTPDEAGRIFFSQVVLKQGIPFSINLPENCEEMTSSTAESIPEQNVEAVNTEAVQPETATIQNETDETPQEPETSQDQSNDMDLTPSKDKGTPDLETGVMIKKQPVTIMDQPPEQSEEKPKRGRKPRAKKSPEDASVAKPAKKRGRKPKKQTEEAAPTNEEEVDEEIPDNIFDKWVNGDAQ